MLKANFIENLKNIHKPFLLLIIFLSSFFSCRNSFNENESEEFHFSSSNPVLANGFEIKVKDGKKTIDLYYPWQSGEVAKRLTLLSSPEQNENLTEGEFAVIPLNRVVCMSATHVSFLEALHETDKIVGVSSSGYVATAELQERIRLGKVKDIGAGDQFRLETLIDLRPDAVFISPQPGQSYQSLINAGITVIPVGEYLENHPLGRAEWIRFFGELFLKTREAEIVFDSIKNDYNQLKQLTSALTEKPLVLSGKQYGGFWNLPGGRSYFAQFIHDAGATYLWSDNDATAGLSLDFETVYLKGVNADFWRFLVYSNQPYSYEMLLAEDKRYEGFKAFQNKNVIVCNTYEKPYHQKGPLEPQIILADLISIFHPQLLPDHQNVYYQLLK
jgi:iron complex transport system substrate-binding protein